MNHSVWLFYHEVLLGIDVGSVGRYGDLLRTSMRRWLLHDEGEEIVGIDQEIARELGRHQRSRRMICDILYT